MPKETVDSPQSTPPERPLKENPHAALEADARDSIAKALRLFENGEREVAEHMFERLRRRVRQASPVAMLISGTESAEERAELQSLVGAIAEAARPRPEQPLDQDDTAAP